MKYKHREHKKETLKAEIKKKKEGKEEKKEGREKCKEENEKK